MKALISTLALVLSASAASADYTCTTRVNNRTFTETANTFAQARREAVRSCERALPGRRDRRCDDSITCRQTPDRRPGLCLNTMNNRRSTANEFFSYAKSYADRNNVCVVARVTTRNGEVRTFDRNGHRTPNLPVISRFCRQMTCR